MTTATRALAWAVLILSAIWYRNGPVIKNCILTKSPLPKGYIANGNYDSQCTTVRDFADKPAESLTTCEDETFWELHDATGKIVERAVIVSCDPGRKEWNTVMGPLRDPNPHGALWIYVPSIPQSELRILSSSVETNKAHRITMRNYPPNHDFHPLGIEVWPSHAGNSSNLYVVNHARERTVIEQFLIDPSHPTQIVHIRTISHPYFLSPNGLALTSPDSFYVSNDHLMTRRLPIVGHVLPLIETILALPLGYVLHVTLHPAGSAHAIAKHAFAKLFIPFANGVAISASGTEVVIVSSTLSTIFFYERDPTTNKLTRLKHSVTVPFSPDNVHYSPSLTNKSQEDVIVAGHPNFPDLSAVAANKTGASASSWIIAIVPKDGVNAKSEAKFDQEAPVSANSKIPRDGKNWTLKTLFQSDGVEVKGGFGGSTTGLRDPDSGAFYVSGLYAREGLLVCKPASEK